jgi:hypothetical protein
MSNGPSVAPRQHSGTECLPPRNQPPRPRIAQLRKTQYPPSAIRPLTLGPASAGLSLSGSGTNRLAPNCFGAEASSANVSCIISASPLTPSQGRGFSCNMTANDNQISEEIQNWDPVCGG